MGGDEGVYGWVSGDTLVARIVVETSTLVIMWYYGVNEKLINCMT